MSNLSNPNHPARWAFRLGSVVLVGAVLFSNSSETTESHDAPSPTVTTSATPSPTPSATPKPTESTKALTASQKDAVRQAEEFMTGSGDSEISVYKWLTRTFPEGGVSGDDAMIALDYLNVDWNEQAVLAAEWYIDADVVGRYEVMGYLDGEGFTKSQIDYALEAVGY